MSNKTAAKHISNFSFAFLGGVPLPPQSKQTKNKEINKQTKFEHKQTQRNQQDRLGEEIVWSFICHTPLASQHPI